MLTEQVAATPTLGRIWTSGDIGNGASFSIVESPRQKGSPMRGCGAAVIKCAEINYFFLW
jgi:hypothetical protein